MKPSKTNFFPFIDTVRSYNGRLFKSDILAGLTVGTILIPQAMAYATLAGVPPIYGLYAALVPLVIYALYASSTKLSVGPVAVSALLVFSGVSKLAEPGSETYLSLVITLGLLVGVIQICIGMFRFGFLANFLSHPVIAGFTSAAAIIIVVSQLNDALGIHLGHHENLLGSLQEFSKSLNEINLPTLGITFISISSILILKKISAKIPGALLALVIATICSYIFKFEDYGIAIIKEVPAGLPSLSIPKVDMDTISILLSTVISVTVIGIVESIGIAKALESKHKDHNLDPNQELLALGLAKVGGSFFLSIPTSGSFSRSAINSSTGGKTTVSSLISALLVLISLLFLTSFFFYLPKAVLAGIILLAVLSLFDYKEGIHLWKTNRKDFMLMLVTFVLTLLLGIEAGVLCGVVLSILLVLYKSSHPNVVELRQITGTNYFKDPSRYENTQRIDDTMIIRFDYQLYFGNAAFFKERLYDMLDEDGREIKYLLLDASHINDIDSTGMHILKDIDEDLKSKNIELHLCSASGPIRDTLFLSGMLTESSKHHIQISDAVKTLCSHSDENSLHVIDTLQTNRS